jgi:hypothetical protein
MRGRFNLCLQKAYFLYPSITNQNIKQKSPVSLDQALSDNLQAHGTKQYKTLFPKERTSNKKSVGIYLVAVGVVVMP